MDFSWNRSVPVPRSCKMTTHGTTIKGRATRSFLTSGPNSALLTSSQLPIMRSSMITRRLVSASRPARTGRFSALDGRRDEMEEMVEDPGYECVFASMPPQGNHFPSIVVSTRDTERQHSGGFPSWPGEHPFWNTPRRTATEEQPRVHKNDKTTRRSCRRTQAPNPEEQQHDKVR